MTSSDSNRNIRKALLVVLVAACAVLLLQIAYQNRAWTVPEAARRLPNPYPASADSLREARSVYLDKCAKCHGESGKGDGREAHNHNPSPADFTDPRVTDRQTDGELFYKLTHGRSPMPEFEDKLTDEQRWRLIPFIRSFAHGSKLSGDPPGPQPQPPNSVLPGNNP